MSTSLKKNLTKVALISGIALTAFSGVAHADSELKNLASPVNSFPPIMPIENCNATFNEEVLSIRDLAHAYSYGDSLSTQEEEDLFINTAAALTVKGCKETLTLLSSISATTAFVLTNGKGWHEALGKQELIYTAQQYAEENSFYVLGNVNPQISSSETTATATTMDNEPHKIHLSQSLD